MRREIKIQWVKRFHLHVCIPHGAPLFLFRHKTLTITMMMTCPYRRIGIGCYFLYHQTTSWILALGQRQKEVSGKACRCRDTFAFAHLCEAENRKENSEANAPKKKKEKHAFKITLLLSRWGAGQDAISRASERSADMFPEPLKYWTTVAAAVQIERNKKMQ